MYDRLVIGIDQSMARTGISIAADEKLKKIGYTDFKGCKSNTEKRQELGGMLKMILMLNRFKSKETIIICERARLQSLDHKRDKAFINTNYLKTDASLVSTIIDTAQQFDVKVYSVDTRSWKAQVVGTSKIQKNKFGIAPEKYPTIKYIESLGRLKDILIEYKGKGKKGVITVNGKRYAVCDDAADSACMALYGFVPERKQSLKEEVF